MKPRAVDKIQAYDTRKRTRSSAAGSTGDATMTTTTSITFPAAAAAVPAAGATDDAAFHPRKKMNLASATTTFNDGWGEFFKNRDNFVEMHIF
jgi:hypothetical protein